MTRRLALLALALLAPSVARAQLWYPSISDEGTLLLPLRPRINFAGGGVSCADDAANLAKTCTVAAGAGGTLQNAYDNGGAGPQVIAEDATRLGVVIRDVAAGTATIFGVQSSGGTTTYLDVQSDTMTLRGGTANGATPGIIYDTVNQFSGGNYPHQFRTNGNALISFGASGATTAIDFSRGDTGAFLGELDVSSGQMRIGTGGALNFVPATSNGADLGTASLSWRTVRAATSVLSPVFDIAAAGAVTIGGTNANAITYGNGTINHTFNGANFQFGASTRESLTATSAAAGGTPTITAANAAGTNVGIDLIPKGTGALQNNGQVIPSVHTVTAQQALEYGTTTLVGGTSTVTFGTAFGAAPQCACTNKSNEAVPKCTTTTTQLTVTVGSSTDTVAYICLGQR